eukprot:scaffold42112_cov62-Phaeocystis_antarctica.AAC.1
MRFSFLGVSAVSSGALGSVGRRVKSSQRLLVQVWSGGSASRASSHGGAERQMESSTGTGRRGPCLCRAPRPNGLHR